MKNLLVRLPNQLYLKLRAVAQNRGAAMADVIQNALEAYLENQAADERSCADLAGNLIGSVDDAPDLATNPAHFRGYGQ